MWAGQTCPQQRHQSSSSESVSHQEEDYSVLIKPKQWSWTSHKMNSSIPVLYLQIWTSSRSRSLFANTLRSVQRSHRNERVQWTRSFELVHAQHCPWGRGNEGVLSVSLVSLLLATQLTLGIYGSGVLNELWISGTFTQHQLKLSTGPWNVAGMSSKDITGKKTWPTKRPKKIQIVLWLSQINNNPSV